MAADSSADSESSSCTRYGVCRPFDLGVKGARLVLGHGFIGSKVSKGTVGALNRLIFPYADLLEVRHGGMYSEIEKTQESRSHFCRELVGSIASQQAMVNVELSVSSSRSTVSEDKVTIKGEEIHKRTVRFRSHMLQKITGCSSRSLQQIRLSDPHPSKRTYKYEFPSSAGYEPFSGKISATRRDIPDAENILQEASFLNDKLERLQKEERNCPIEDLCWKLLDSPLVGGATHFVSAVHLGAKVVEVKSSTSAVIGKNTSAKFGLGASKASLHVGLNKETVERSATSYGQIVALLDPSVSLQGINTVVEPHQEKIIGLELSPISLLICDPVGARGLEKVCKERLKENWRKQPIITIDSGTPVLVRIIVDSKWLVADDKRNRVVASESKELASSFYIEQVEEGDKQDKRFYIHFLPPGSHRTRQYMSLDSEGTAELKNYTTGTDDVFFMAHVRDRAPINGNQLSNTEPILICRETSVRRRRQYLAVSQNTSTDDRLGEISVVTGTFDTSQTGLSTQFYLQNDLLIVDTELDC